MSKQLVTWYTLAFNSLSTLAWTAVGWRCIEYYALQGRYTDFYTAVKLPVQIAQTLAVLEIVHAAAGIVRSSPVTAAMQVLSRLHMVWIVWHQLPLLAAKNWAVASAIVAWTLAELIRFPFYISGTVLTSVPAPLQYVRYSAFMVLYPLGITSEVVCVVAALPHMLSETRLRHWPVAMPNNLNFEIALFPVYMVILVLYIPGSVILFSHMLRQRKKALGSKVLKSA